MTIRFRKLLALVFVCISKILFAAPPSSTINPEEYRYTLSITAVLIENCEELKNPDNLLIANINGQMRGFVHSSTTVGNRFMAFLTVYSNVPSGDTIKFQIYKADVDKLIDVKTTVVFQDDGIFGNPSVPKEIHTNNRPTDLQLSQVLIPETYTGNPVLATISAIDIDKDNTLSYALVAGANSSENGFFKVSGNQLFYNGKVNTAIKDTFNIRLSATDNFGCSVEKEFKMIVDKINDAPTGLEISNASFFENESNPIVGSFSTTDPDLFDQFSYSFASGAGDADNSKFIISDGNLVFKSSANFELKNIYSIKCRTTDSGGLTFDSSFTIHVKDKNDPPTNIVLSNKKVYENEPSNQLVAKLSSIDEDTWDRYEYVFANIGTNDNTSFVISNDSLKANKRFDFETKSSYFIYLTSIDSSGISVTKSFTITIKDTLDVPTDLLLENTSMPENAPKNTFIGKLSTVDANTAPVIYTYSFVSGLGSADSSSFRISNDSLFNKEEFDFETRNSYEIRIRSTLVNGMSVEKSFKMTVLNVNERPVFLSINRDSIPENTSDSAYVASFSTIDPDKDRFAYSLVSGANDAGNKSFTIKNGILLLVKPANYEKQSSYRIRVRTTDTGGEFLDSVLTIYIKDVNEQCRIVPQTYEILELATQQTELGSIEVKDDDKNQTYLFEIQNPDVPFSINATTGMLVLNGRIDYEKKSQYDVWVKITDSGNPALSDSISIRINVLDEIEDDILPSADLVSPNGDEKNDTWKITNVALYKDFALDIVDENGQSVYSISSNYNNDWDAKFRGSPLPSGVYYYVFKSNTSGKLYKGYITVVK